MFHDTVMSLVVVCVIIGLACVWYFTSSEEPGDAGILGPRYADEADPGTTSFMPRPDWYFYFLFYLLRIFKWPDSVVLGTVGIPTIALILLVVLPFIDRRRERRLLRRPVAVVGALLVIASMGVLTYKGATAKEALASENVELVGEWTETQGLSEEGAPGRDPLRRVGLHELPHVPRRRLQQPRRARPLGHRRLRNDRRGVLCLRGQPGAVRKHSHACVRQSRRGEPRPARDFLEESKGEGGGGR